MKSLTKKNDKAVDLEEEGYPKNAIVDNAFTIAAPVHTQTAQEAYNDVLKYAGASLPKRDAVDTRVINETQTATAIGKGVFGKPGIIDSPIAVGGLGTYATAQAALDTDGDGMPDEWELKNKLDPKDASDRNKKDANGYTMLEKYLNELATIK